MIKSLAVFSAALVLSACAGVQAQLDPTTRPGAVAITPSRIVGVTVYQTNALVTRQVTAPDGAGAVELTVGPLPPSTVSNSLYSEGTDGLRVLTTRYRTRVMRENIQEEMRRLETQMKDLRKEAETIQRQIAAIEQNNGLLGKLEGFTAGSLQHLTEKGQLNAESVTKIAEFIMTTRLARSAEITALQQKLAAINEQVSFLQREAGKVSGGSDKTVREAVIVVDKPAGAGTVKFHYLVSAASWRPQYKLRAAKGKPDVQMEYLAAIQQQSGEDWNDVDMVLSTAEPRLNAAPPELSLLRVSVGGARGGVRALEDAETLQREATQLRQQGQSMANVRDERAARMRFNEAAAMEQSWDILNPADPNAAGRAASRGAREGQHVSFHLERRFSVPWRDEEQLIEVARLALKADYFHKAVPVLTPHVYRLANFVNDSKLVILPGEATVYQEADFVGCANLPLVAIGEQFTAGFGVDPQLQVQRDLVEKAKSVQGGNHVLKFDYRVLVSSYKSEPVKLQLWDRLPYSEADSVGVTFISAKPDLSKDAEYLRDQRPRNLLRWDLTVEPGARGEKALSVAYQFSLAVDRQLVIPPPAQPAGKSSGQGLPSPADSMKMLERYDLKLE